MSITSKLKEIERIELAAILFYIVSGILLLVSLPLTSFPPHVAFLGVLSLIVAYSLFAKRAWALWLTVILFAAAIVFSVYTLYMAGLSNILVSASMLLYAVLSVVFAGYVVLKRDR